MYKNIVTLLLSIVVLAGCTKGKLEVLVDTFSKPDITDGTTQPPTYDPTLNSLYFTQLESFYKGIPLQPSVNQTSNDYCVQMQIGMRNPNGIPIQFTTDTVINLSSDLSGVSFYKTRVECSLDNKATSIASVTIPVNNFYSRVFVKIPSTTPSINPISLYGSSTSLNTATHRITINLLTHTFINIKDYGLNKILPFRCYPISIMNNNFNLISIPNNQNFSTDPTANVKYFGSYSECLTGTAPYINLTAQGAEFDFLNWNFNYLLGAFDYYFKFEPTTDEMNSQIQARTNFTDPGITSISNSKIFLVDYAQSLELKGVLSKPEFLTYPLSVLNSKCIKVTLKLLNINDAIIPFAPSATNNIKVDVSAVQYIDGSASPNSAQIGVDPTSCLSSPASLLTFISSASTSYPYFDIYIKASNLASMSPQPSTVKFGFTTRYSTDSGATWTNLLHVSQPENIINLIDSGGVAP